MMSIIFLASKVSSPAIEPSSGFDWKTLLTSALVAAVISAIVAMVGQWVSRKNAKLAAEIARENARLTANLEVAQTLSQSRQEWINILREDMAQFVGLAVARSRILAVGSQLETEDFAKIVALGARIRMRMNRQDADYDKLLEIMKGCTTAKDASEIGKASNEFVVVSQNILKREWEVLKRELQSIGVDS